MKLIILIIFNILLLTLFVILWCYQKFQRSIELEIKELISSNKIDDNQFVKKNDIKELPEPVQKWLFNTGIIGKPFISVGKIIQKAKIKMKPEQENWLKSKAIQYTTINNPAFLWKVDVKINNLFRFKGRDLFKNGKGEMLIKMNSLVKIVDEKGEKLDEGTIQRYLGEMVWFPSLALSPYITWEKIDSKTVKASINYKRTKGSGIFYFDSKGDIIRFSALRYKGNETNAERYNWIIDILDYKEFEGIKVPSLLTSTWKLEDGDWTWLELEIVDIKYNKNIRY